MKKNRHNVISLNAEVARLQSEKEQVEARIREATDALKSKENKVIDERNRLISTLPGMFEVSNIDEVISLLQEAKAPKVAIRYKVRRGKNIPDEVKAAVIQAVKNGLTGKAIAKEYRISLPSVSNIKNAAGLVKHRKIAA